MLPKPRADLKPNTAEFERWPLVKPTGFREYDARWLYPQEINLMGLNAIGLGLATLAGRRGVPKRFVVAYIRHVHHLPHGVHWTPQRDRSPPSGR